MSKVVLVLACVALFHIASALECYHCDKEECVKDMKQWQKTQCGKTTDTTKENACLKATYKDKAGKEWISRKCVQAPLVGNFPCDIAESTDPVCATCKTELCNSASSFNLSFAAIAGMMLVYLVPKFLV